MSDVSFESPLRGRREVALGLGALVIPDGDGNGADLVHALDVAHEVRSGYGGVRALELTAPVNIIVFGRSVK